MRSTERTPRTGLLVRASGAMAAVTLLAGCPDALPPDGSGVGGGGGATSSSSDASGGTSAAGCMTSSSGSGGATSYPDGPWRFDNGGADIDRWSVTTTHTPPSQPELTQDPCVGDPNPGSAKLTVVFTAAEPTDDDESAIVWNSFTAPQDLTGKVLVASVRLDEGILPSFYTQLYVKYGPNYTFCEVADTVDTTPSSSWIKLRFDTNKLDTITCHPETGPLFAPTDMMDVHEVGVVFGTHYAAQTTTVVHIDTIEYE